MDTISISTMTPDMVMRKSAFGRAVPKPTLGSRPIGSRNTPYRKDDSMRYEIFTQDDFLREYDVNAHRINSIRYYNNYAPAGTKQKIKVQTRVAIGFQERILTKRLTALIGNNVNIRLIRDVSGTNINTLAMLREGWEERDMEIAMHRALKSDGITGDCAVNFFLSDGKAGWRVFSHTCGDTLYPHNDPMTGELVLFGRSYVMNSGADGKPETYLDVWDRTHYMRWKSGADGKGWAADAGPTPHNFPSCPVAYHRYGDTYWAPSQSLIDSYELALSQFCENNSAYALRILYTLGQSMEVMANFDGTPTRIDSADTDAKVGFLEPADASSSFEAQLNIMEKNIMRSSFAVETPEIKSGSDMSSLTVKMLFADTYLKALEDSQEYKPFLGRCMSLFKYAYGVETGRTTDFNRLKVKAEFDPFIFMSESETINGIVQLVAAGALSRRSASEIAYTIGYGTVAEWDRLIGEAHEEYMGTAAQRQDLNAVGKSRASE